MDEWGITQDIAAQLPVVVLVLGVVFFFVREMRKERDAAAERSDKRDEVFTEALDRNSTAISANTQTLKDLDKTIALLGQKVHINNVNNGRFPAGEGK